MKRSNTTPRSFSTDQLRAALGEVGGAARPDYLPDIVAQAGRVRQRPAWTFLQRAPDRVLERMLASLDTTTQRRTVPGRPWRFPPMPSAAKLALMAVAIAAVGFVGLTFMRGPVIGPAASPSPTASPSAVSPTPGPRSDAEQVIAEGTLESFAANESGSVLTVWGTCQDFGDTDCGYAWRLGTGSQPQATGMVGLGDARVDANAASGSGFVLTPASQHDRGFLIAQDGTSSPLAEDRCEATWSTATEPGRRVWVAGLSFVDTVAGVVCDTSILGARPLARGAFTEDGTLWALVDNEMGPETLTIGKYDGARWQYRDLTPTGMAWESAIAATGSTVVVVHARTRVIGLSVTTDAGATWHEVTDADVLERDLPFSTYALPKGESWFSDYSSMAFAGPSALYVADGRGDLWRSTDFTRFSQVSVAGRVSDLKPAGDAVIARLDGGSDLLRINADGGVAPFTAR